MVLSYVLFFLLWYVCVVAVMVAGNMFVRLGVVGYAAPLFFDVHEH